MRGDKQRLCATGKTDHARRGPTRPPAIINRVEADTQSSDPDRLPDSTDPNGPCPRCGRVANFALFGDADVTFKRDVFTSGRDGSYGRSANQRVAVLECSGCNDRVVVIEDELVGGRKGGRAGTITWEGIFWWPTPGAKSLGPSVPTDVAAPYDEGVRCLSAGAPNGAVAMFRTAMTCIVNDKGSEAAKAKGDLAETLIELLYVTPAKIAQRQAERLK